MSYKSKSQVSPHAKVNLKSQPALKDQRGIDSGWTAKVITLYPEMFPGTLGHSLIGQALRKKIWSLEILNLREFGIGKHKDVDDTPAGGGPGMVLRPDVVDGAVGAAIQNLNLKKEKWSIINLSPRGSPLTQEISQELVSNHGIIVLCGRFEGIDQRVIDKWNMRELSIGDFILTGGEIAAQALIDSIVRNIPNVLGNNLSIKSESFSDNLLAHPQYTKPSNWNGHHIPEILLSGNHGKVREWRNKKSFEITKIRRPDLLIESKKFSKVQ